MMRLHWVNSEEMKSAIEALPAARNHTISYQTQTSLTIFEGQALTPPASVEGRKYRLELTNTLPEKVADYDGQQAIRKALVDAAEEIDSQSAGVVREIGIWASVRGCSGRRLGEACRYRVDFLRLLGVRKCWTTSRRRGSGPAGAGPRPRLGPWDFACKRFSGKMGTDNTWEQATQRIVPKRGIHLHLCRSIRAEGAFVLLKSGDGFLPEAGRTSMPSCSCWLCV